MTLGERICLLLNRFFPKKRRTGRGSPQAYSEAEYRWASASMAMHAPHIDLKGAVVLDAGCGLGGKTIFFAERGCDSIVGIDIDENHAKYAMEFARTRQTSNAAFLVADLEALPFRMDTFDIVMLNDVVEHIRKPVLIQALAECKRVVRPNGRICLEFPPWQSPDAAHLYDYIRIPWCQLFFSKQTLINVTKAMNPGPRHGRLSVIEHFLELNQITVAEFKNAVKELNLKVVNFELRMIRNLKPLGCVPFLNKYLTSRAVAVLSK